MNKKLVAVAVAGVLAAPLAAQAQTANVTLYGRLNITLEYIDANGSRPSVQRLSSNSSRLGVRGVESLGGGLNAIFQIESSISGDAGGGTLAGRDTFVGLQGSWGTVRLGNFLAPYDDMHPIFGNVPTFTTSILSTASIWAQGTSAKAAGGFDARLGNSIRYDTPNIAGFVGSAQISLDSENGAVDPYVFSVGGVYNNGPFQGGVAFEKNKDVRAAGLDDWAFTLAAAWNFGIARLSGVYERLDYDTPAGSLKRNYYGVGVTWPVGPGTVYGFYGHASSGKGGGSRVAGLASGADTEANEWEISYTYPLSKRTITYVGYHRIDNDANAAYNYNINPYAPASNGMKLNGFVVGIVHLF
ncbi:MAG TPA: porin [Casimicrobiaceae bacterium]|nr:porin [Casimicrobiaceae bacterium]